MTQSIELENLTHGHPDRLASEVGHAKCIFPEIEFHGTFIKLFA